ncbi:MAG: hypothetical protein WCG04_00360 [Alphaproteobacteria bacterium]
MRTKLFLQALLLCTTFSIGTNAASIQDLETKPPAVERNILAVLPQDITGDVVLDFFDIQDLKSLSPLMATCRLLRDYVLDRYSAANDAKQFHPWQAHPELLPSTVYFINNQMCTLLGLHANISNGCADDADWVPFKIAYRFLARPLREREQMIIPGVYAELFQAHLADLDPTVDRQALDPTIDHQALYEETFAIANTTFQEKYSMSAQHGQSELALYLHHHKFVLNMAPQAEEHINNQPNVPNALLASMNTELLALKNTPGLDRSARFAEIWNKIIDLDPEATVWQLREASFANHEAKNYTESTKFCEEVLRLTVKHGHIVKIYDYKNAAIANFEARNYARSAELYEDWLRAIDHEEQTPTADQYNIMAYANLKAEKYARAAELYESCLASLPEGHKPTADSYKYIAFANLKAKNYESAVVFYDTWLKALPEGQKPTEKDYKNIAHAYFKTEQYARAARYLEIRLMILPTGQDTTAKDYRDISDAYFYANEPAKAAKYYELSIQTPEAQQPTAMDYDNITRLYKAAGNRAKATDYRRKWRNALKGRSV